MLETAGHLADRVQNSEFRSRVTMILFSSARFAEHVTPPGHPERPERAEVMDAVAARVAQRGGDGRRAARGHARGAGARAHGRLSRRDRRPRRAVLLDPDTLDADTLTRHASRCWPPARRLTPVERVMGGPAQPALALVRPPGPSRRARSRDGILSLQQRRRRRGALRARSAPQRVAIVDYRRPPRQRHAAHRSTPIRTCCTSRPISIRTTRARARPTRSASVPGRGFTVNLPLEAGATDDGLPDRLRGRRAAGAAAVQPDVDSRVGRLRRARARSARRACG